MEDFHPDKPPAGATIKAWGWSLELSRDQHSRFVRACVRRGGTSSIHRHERQDNVFLLISGALTVSTFDDDGPSSIKLLNESNHCVRVAAGVKHRFRAITDCLLYELYTGVDGHAPEESDIVREAA